MSDLSTKGRVRLTAAEPGGNDKPLAKAVAVLSFVRSAAGARPAITTEPFLPFGPLPSVEDFDSGLRTTGFEGFEDTRSAASEAASENMEPAAPITIAVPVSKPVLEVKPPAAPIAVYEPMEFIDYDDDDPFAEPEPEPEPEAPPPPALTSLLPVALPDASKPAHAKPQAGFAAAAFADAPVELPELSIRIVRRKLVYGPNPFAPKPEPVTKVEVKQAPEAVPPPAPAPAPAAVPKVAAAVAKPAPAARPAPPSVVQRPAAAAAAAAAPAIKSEPSIRPEPARSEPTVRPEQEKRPAAKSAPPAPPSRPVRDRSNAVPVEEVIPEPPPPALKPKMVPIRKPEPLAPAATVADAPMIGMPAAEKSGGSKIAIAAVVLVVLAGGGYFMFSGGKSTGSAGSEAADSISDSSSTGMIIGGGGWTTTWGAESPNNKGKQISIYRPSMTMPDYRLEFRGQIERKAMGWIFRASNPKNYYVMKLEILKPGPAPIVALVKYAVIEGKETTHTQVMLPFEVKADTVYQVRLDVKGDKFTTYVQGKLVDHWSDDRVKLGGTGFYNEPGERAQIKSSQVSYAR